MKIDFTISYIMFKRAISLFAVLLFVYQSNLWGQCSLSCGIDNALSGETSCLNIGVPYFGIEIGIDALNGSTNPQIINALNGNELVNKLDNCCGNDDDCVSIFFTVPASGGAYALEEINALGSGSVYMDCSDLSPFFNQPLTYSSNAYELIFCPPGGSGSKRIGLAPVFEIETVVSHESFEGFNDGEISVSYTPGNPNVQPTGTVKYSIDGIGGSTENTTGVFTNLEDGFYTVHVYDGADTDTYNTVNAVVGPGSDCDVSNAMGDCDGDGVVNGSDCDPADPSILGPGGDCTTSGGLAGTLDVNCYCIANSGGTSSGGDGGLESNSRLAQKIAQRNYRMKRDNSNLYHQRINGNIPFAQVGTPGKSSDIVLGSLIPTQLWGAYVAESTPIGLVDITNATEVLGVDYYMDGLRTAVALVLRSENGVYEHSKYVCDRLDGAQLTNIVHTPIMGKDFITYEILNLQGETEYALSFSGHIQAGGVVLENHWNLDDYPASEEYINFQIWASSQEKLQSLTTSVIENLNNQVPVMEYHITGIPQAFVRDGFYQNGALYLTIINKGPSTTLKVQGVLRRSETGENESYGDMLYLSEDTSRMYRLETGHFYDIGLQLNDQKGYHDGLFMADGTWGVDEITEYAEVHDFEILPQEQSYGMASLQLERGVYCEASVKSYINIYRSLTPKWNPVDLTAYNSISFKARGSGRVELSIVRQGETEWSRQMRTVLTLSEDPVTYTLAFSDFFNYTTKEDMSDIYMLVVTLLGEGETFSDKTLDLSDIRFHTVTTTATREESLSDHVVIYPNPTADIISIANLSHDVSVDIINGEGRIIMQSSSLRRQDGTMDVRMLSPGVYFLRIRSSEGGDRIEKFIKLP